MSLTEQKIYNALNELKGMSADQVTHFLKNYGGIERESMIDGLLAMLADLCADKEKAIKNIMIGCGVSFAVAVAVVIALGIIVFKNARKKDEAKINEIIEQLKNAKAEEIIDIECKVENSSDISLNEKDLEHECPQCGKIAHNVDEVTTMFGYKETEELELIPEIFCKECRGYN